MNILIIEDEMKAALELKSLITQLNAGFQIVDIIRSVEEGLKWFSVHAQPDLIFADIQLGDGSSFEILRQVKLKIPVIFCTAYNEYALQAFDANGIDYLLKPVEIDKLDKSFNKLALLQNNFQKDGTITLANMLQQMQDVYKTTLLVYFKNKIMPVSVDDIDYIFTQRNVVYVVTHGQQFEYRKTLDELMLSLNPALFYRANRQFIISRRTISSIETLFTRKLQLILSVNAPEAITISKAKSADFLKWMQSGI